MKRHSWLAFWALASSACGMVIDIPQLQQLSSSDGTSASGGSASTAAGGSGSECHDCSAGAGGTEPANGGGRGLGGASGSSTGGSGGAPTGGSGGDGACKAVCDCDDDTYLSTEGSCGGDDCDDHDPLVHPGQTKYFGVRAKNDAVGFDYDCSSDLERDPAQGGDAILNCGLLGLANCAAAAQAFEKTLPACGDQGAWGGCAKVPPLNATCAAQVLDNKATARCH